MGNTPKPVNIALHQARKVLEIKFDDDSLASLSTEYLRVFSPSAEVKGHSPSQEVLQTGKRQVNIVGIEPVGNYAIKLVFDDGHNTGIYTWEYLHELSTKQQTNWQDYIHRLAVAGQSRD